MKQLKRSYKPFTKRTAKELIDPPIIQFSPPRTGSTLVYNFLRELFPERKVSKTHKLPHRHLDSASRADIICTVRHPLDTIASRILRHDPEFSDESIERVSGRRGEFEFLAEIRNDPRVLILRYERFVNNFDFAFDGIEGHFGIEITQQSRTRLSQAYSIEAVRSKADKLGAFKNYDPVDHIHGQHISRFGGRPGYYREVFLPNRSSD